MYEKNNHDKSPIDIQQELSRGLESAHMAGAGVIKRDTPLSDDERLGFRNSLEELTGDSYGSKARSVVIDLERTQFGPVSQGEDQGFTVFTVDSGEGTLKSIRGKIATESHLESGDIVILDGTNDDTWFNIEGEGKLQISTYATDKEQVARQDKSGELHSLGAIGRKREWEAQARASKKRAKKFGKAIRKLSNRADTSVL